MLYSLYEAQHTALAPYRSVAEFWRGWFGNPFSPLAFVPLSKEFTAGNDLFLRVTQRYEKPAWGIDRTQVQRQFAPDNVPDKNVWFHVDVPLMRKMSGGAPDPKLDAFFLEAGAEILLETARVWASTAAVSTTNDGSLRLPR